MGESGESESEVCADCGVRAPPTETNYTLISNEYGWRLIREQLPNGTWIVEWRCPECWRARKERLGQPHSKR